MLTLLPGLLRPSREGALCLYHLERAPSAFVSDASSVSRALLVFCVNQGISASLSLLLSYRQLQTTRFQSIKGPQHVAPEQGHWCTGISVRGIQDLLRLGPIEVGKY